MTGDILRQTTGARGHLHLVPRLPPARPRLREVRLTALAGRYPYGGVTRSFQLTDRDLAELLAHAERLEVWA